MVVTLKTGIDIWAVIDLEDKQRVIAETAHWLAYALEKYNGQRTAISGLNEPDQETVRNMADQIRARWSKQDEQMGRKDSEFNSVPSATLANNPAEIDAVVAKAIAA